ncbi:MAG: DEAD/DEAH box helicase [Proteobacteria bacterium]|nr:MAG: DEAD/DEAH box helicase [Pseudomonadota bacterium]
MGLGKTIQVLAMLLRYHTQHPQEPSLIVVPRSLVSNWASEAEKFCPSLKIMDLSGTTRDWTAVARDQPDLVITTYGLLRQDIKDISKISFAYAVLDESQIIKNQGSLAAKATLLIKSRHRLAMSGTPIENHMRELMSLMNFLNPGLLDSPHWKEVFSKKFDAQNPFVKNLVTAIRPLMLRRTKALVLKDLPAKVEDVLYCDLEGEQKLHYEQLRKHYQINLLPQLQDANWKKSSIVLIEALLRMRQAACHSGLVDKEFSHVPSSKLETLFDKLQEIRASGHKALIFSQFTSFLKIAAAQFSQEGIPFEYLDGSTRDRAARVNRFQSDPSVPFFLISLKAGGVGLNLTAADYCFILDPWWNPAAEAQAIDRAHRINQKNTVFAYRLIARGTVEEKIQALQRNKREMVESILDGEGSLIKELDLKSIQSLFS